jgi:hypothetical protein
MFAFSCGMGHVPALGQRFLAAYVEEVLQAASPK